MATRKPRSTSEQYAHLGEAIRQARTLQKLSQTEVADAAEVSQQTLSKVERGEQGTDLDKLSRIAGAVGLDLAKLLAGDADPRLQTGRAGPSTVFDIGARIPTLRIRDRVQAGAWLAVDELAQTSLGSYPIGKDPKYGSADQWVSQVVGDSVDKLFIFDGDLVLCVSIADIGYYPQTGDIVEVERVRYGGQLIELTLKQIEVEGDRVLLWPRSSNPRWQEPLDLRQGAAEQEDVEIRIRGLVRSVIRRL